MKPSFKCSLFLFFSILCHSSLQKQVSWRHREEQQWSLSRSLTKLNVLGCVSRVQSNLFARLQCPIDGQTLHIELQLTGQQIADDHCWQQINGMARLPENLFSTVREDAGRHVIWVILFLYSHTKPENAKREMSMNLIEQLNPVFLYCTKSSKMLWLQDWHLELFST